MTELKGLVTTHRCVHRIGRKVELPLNRCSPLIHKQTSKILNLSTRLGDANSHLNPFTVYKDAKGKKSIR